MELRKCGMTFSEYSMLFYRKWLWNYGASIDEPVNQEAWATSDAYQDMLTEWNEGKVE